MQSLLPRTTCQKLGQLPRKKQARSAVVAVRSAQGDPLLEVKDLSCRIAGTEQQILSGVNLTVQQGEVHAIMGKNGSGKSTLSKVITGHYDYEVTSGTVLFKGQNILELEPEERARLGIFMSFQSPIEVPGVQNIDFLRAACNSRRKAQGEAELDPLEFYSYLGPKLQSLKMDPTFMSRNVNEGFSGGEKKRNEILQLSCLEAQFAILDEIDSGLDVDALRDVSSAVNGIKSEDRGILMVTHYKRLLDLIQPDVVHIMDGGAITVSGDVSIADKLESGGYANVA